MPTTVLIADESVTIRSVAESLLRGESYSVHSAADGNLALELAQAEKPNLALIGEKLAGRSGEEVCNAIKNDPDLKDTPIIFLRADQAGGAPTNVDFVLTKPFSPQSLLDAVHRFVASEASATRVESPLAAAPDPALEDELIDQALGLDDVGPAPAEEREVSTKAATQTDEDGAEEGMSATFGMVEELETRSEDPASESDDDPELGQISVDADSLELSQPPQVRDPVDDELDRALDVALSSDDRPLDQPKQASKSEELAASSETNNQSSLHEISLGDSDDAPIEPAGAPAALPPVPGQGIELGGPDAPIEAAGDRPHDYDWFINEMQQETDDKGTPAPPEPPSIEPVEPRAPVEAEPPRPTARTDSQIQIDGSEELDESRRGYDEFITEFRAEIAKLEGMAAPPPAPADEDTRDTKHAQAGEIAFADSKLDHVPPPQAEAPVPPATTEAQLREMSNMLIDSVTQLVARELAAKIDSKAIYALIEQKLKEADQQKNQS